MHQCFHLSCTSLGHYYGYNCSISLESGKKWPKHTHYNPVQWDDMHCNDIIDHSVYQPSMTFPNESLAILTDGLCYMMMLDTGNRNEQKKWKVSVLMLQ